MNLFQKQQTTTSGYASIPDAIAAADETALFLGTTITPSPPTTTTRSYCWWKWMIAIVAGMMMLMMAGSGAVWMRPEGSSDPPAVYEKRESLQERLVREREERARHRLGGGRTSTTTTAAEGLIVATQRDNPCLPAGGAFSGVSTTTNKQRDPFETCYQYGKEEKYCWTKSYRNVLRHGFSPCVPDPRGGVWQTLDPKYVNTPGVDPNTNPKRCGPPCQGQHPK